MKILLVEDEPAIREPLARLLTSEGWQVLCVGTQAQALELVEQNTVDAALIDLGLPDGDGFAVSRAVRTAGDAAILILTARTDEWSAVQSLEGGADDYIEKPFRARELIARLRAVLRRRAQNGKERYICRGLEVDLRTMQAFLNGTPLELTAQEYRLLRIFLTHAGQVLERGQLLQLLWDQGGNYVNDNTLTVTVKRLREKLEPEVQGKAERAMREKAGASVQEESGLPVQRKTVPPDRPFITTVRGVRCARGGIFRQRCGALLRRGMPCAVRAGIGVHALALPGAGKAVAIPHWRVSRRPAGGYPR